MALISIVIPVYYNEASLLLLQTHLDALALKFSTDTFEFVYVDDGSGDHSLQVLEGMARADSRLVVLRLARNFGSNAAVLAGLSHAMGDCAGFIAADLQDPPETLFEMIQLWKQGAEVVLAVRKDRKGDPFLTRTFARFTNWLLARFVFQGYAPEGIGFFLVDRKVVRVLVEAQEKNAHLIGLVLWVGFRRKSIVYDRVEREHGSSRWTFGKKFKYLIDVFASFSYLPLRIASALGVTLSMLGGVYAVIILIARLFGDIPVQGFTALIIVVLVTAGVQLLLLGVLGEYLWRNLDESRKRPPFIVASILAAAGAQRKKINQRVEEDI